MGGMFKIVLWFPPPILDLVLETAGVPPAFMLKYGNLENVKMASAPVSPRGGREGGGARWLISVLKALLDSQYSWETH
jgi:hypothetical protein